MPLLKDRQVLLLFDSWYAKSPLIERVLQYPHLAFICNVRSDLAMYESPPLPSGKPGRPKNEESGFIWMISTCPGTWTA